MHEDKKFDEAEKIYTIILQAVPNKVVSIAMFISLIDFVILEEFNVVVECKAFLFLSFNTSKFQHFKTLEVLSFNTPKMSEELGQVANVKSFMFQHFKTRG